MKAEFKTFQSGIGDCIFFTLKDKDKQFVIMVDCGRYSEPIKDYIEKQLNNHIDLLVVTHIDADHVEGVTCMLNEIPDLSIGEIWFNSYQRSSDGVPLPLTDNQILFLKRLYAKIPQVVDVLNTKVNADHAMTLSETILGNSEWADVWRRDPIKVGLDNYPLCDGSLGTIRILSPTHKELDALDEVFLSLFYEFFYEEHPDGSLEKDTTLYELLIRVAQERDDFDQFEPEQISSLTLDAKTIIDYKNNKIKSLTPENKASIAFVWEYKDHRILFLGDASPDVVKDSLIDLYGECETKFDAVKVSHHGSAHSTSVALMDLIDSFDFFFTGGGGNKRPHIEAVSRIISKPLQPDAKPRTLHFNYQNDWTTALERTELQQQLGYTLDFTTNELIYDI